MQRLRLSRKQFSHKFFALASAVVLSACGDTAPQVPTSLTTALPTVISAAVGTTASLAPAVTLHDARGNGIANIWVHFAVTGGGKVVNDSARTSTAGLASAGTWTLGTAAGPQTVVATASGLTPVIFTINTAAGPAFTIRKLSADSQNAVVATALVTAPSVRVLDQYGNPVSGATVTFAVLSGNGTLAGASKITGSNGIAAADSWTLGTVAGPQTVRADVSGLTAATITEITVASTPASIAIVGGNGGNGIVGSSLASFSLLPSVKITDAFGNPVAGVTVTFTPGPNSGTVRNGVVVTNDAGIATVTDWVLGSATTQTLLAVASAIPGASAVFTIRASTSGFDITVRYVDGAPSARQQLAVQRAVDKWKSVITSNSGTSKLVLPAGSCGRTWMPAINETITNVLILAKIGPIDGVGNVVGNASSCVLHNTGPQLTALGTMYFDSDDLASLEGSGLIDVVILHEMGHVLGIGSQWSLKGLITGRGTNDPYTSGANALTQFALIGGSTYTGHPVPIENLGGTGTADVHWRESVFHNELMTGYLNSGVNPMSSVTVGALADLGYTVQYANADAFTIASSLLLNPFAAKMQLHNDIVETELFTTDMQGRHGVPRAHRN
jgi:hypothetical protein